MFNGSFERGYNRTLAIDLFCHSNCTDLTSQADVTQRILDGQAASDGNFSGGNNSSALSNAGLVPADSMALQEAGDASGYDTGSGLLSGFGNGDDDDDDLEASISGEKREQAVDDDEQVGELSFDDVDINHFR